jgi:hypothetical protein
MKLRYTPVQHPVLAAEAPESPHHAVLAGFTSLAGTPVVCAELHSQVAAAAAGARAAVGDGARIAYVMTDGGALVAGLSRLLPRLREAGLIDVVVTAGQALGGDFEAVNVYSALAVAATAGGADVVVVGQGPGNAGTSTPLGFSGLDQGIALNAAASLGGSAIAAVRISFSDRRPRHHGLSHHTVTVLSRVALRSVVVALPRLPAVQRSQIAGALHEAGITALHRVVTVDARPGLDALRRADVPVTTMGRDVSDDPAFFLAAAAAGVTAGRIARRRRARLRPREVSTR